MHAKVNDNAYKIDLLDEYNVSATFHMSDISFFDLGDNSWMNLFKERGNDREHQARNPNRAARIQGLVERAFSNDCIEETELAMELR